jgi:magnesium transporter
MMRRRAKPGILPGTVRSQAEAPPPQVRLITYDSGHFSERDVEDVGAIKRELVKAQVAWIDVQGLGDAKVIRSLGKQFDLHPLAMEDVVNTHQRPKLENYDDHLFMVLRTVTGNDHFGTDQVAIFLTKTVVLTFREKPDPFLEPIVERLRRSRGRLRDLGADYLTYAIVDAAVDGFFPFLQTCGERLDELDEEVSRRPQEGSLLGIRKLKGDLIVLRRAAWPLRDAIGQMLRDETPLLSDETRIFLRDCQDHAVQIIDLVQVCVELCDDIRDFYLTQVNNRLSEIMKVLTIIATIFMPLSFIAGLYGMNFDPSASAWNMPELRWSFGYPAALGVMAAMAGGMLLFFWRRGWLGR